MEPMRVVSLPSHDIYQLYRHHDCIRANCLPTGKDYASLPWPARSFPKAPSIKKVPAQDSVPEQPLKASPAFFPIHFPFRFHDLSVGQAKRKRSPCGFGDNRRPRTSETTSCLRRTLTVSTPSPPASQTFKSAQLVPQHGLRC